MASHRLVLDSGALSVLAEKKKPLRLALNRALSTNVSAVLVPTVVVAEATTGDQRRDAAVNQTLKSTTLISLDIDIARAAAALRHAYRRGGAGTIDAIVVATADVVPGSEVLTADYKDLTLLASVKGQTRVVRIAEALRS